MSVTVTVDTSGGENYIASLSRALPGYIREIIAGEAGTILKECVVRTDVAKRGRIDARAASQANRSVRVRLHGSTSSVKSGEFWRNSRQRGSTSNNGRIWWRAPSKSGAKFVLLFGAGGQKIWGAGRPQRLRKRGGFAHSATLSNFPSRQLVNKADYFRVQVTEEAKAFSAAGRKASGLARQSWVQIADAVGVKLEAVQGGRSAGAAIAKARAAIASDGNRYLNGYASWILSRLEAFVKLRNVYPLAEATRMDSTLRSVMNGRQKYYDESVRRGMAKTAEGIAKKFRNIRITP